MKSFGQKESSVRKTRALRLSWEGMSWKKTHSQDLHTLKEGAIQLSISPIKGVVSAHLELKPVGSAPGQAEATEDQSLSPLLKCFLWEPGLKLNARGRPRLIIWAIPTHTTDFKMSLFLLFSLPGMFVPQMLEWLSPAFLQVSAQISSYWEAFPGHTIKVSDKQC